MRAYPDVGPVRAMPLPVAQPTGRHSSASAFIPPPPSCHLSRRRADLCHRYPAVTLVAPPPPLPISPPPPPRARRHPPEPTPSPPPALYRASPLAPSPRRTNPATRPAADLLLVTSSCYLSHRIQTPISVTGHCPDSPPAIPRALTWKTSRPSCLPDPSAPPRAYPS